MSFWVYVLQSETTGEIYIGQTHDLAMRLAQHNDPDHDLTLHTKRRKGPWRLVYSEECPTRSAAVRRERQLKCGAGRRFIRGLLAALPDSSIGRASGC